MKINTDRINLVIELEGEEINVREKFKVDIKLAEETINQDLKEQAPLFAWYAVMFELANEIYEEAELALGMLKAQLGTKYRKEAAKAGTKLREADFNNKIALDDNYIAAQIEVIQAKRNVGILKAYKNSFAQRKETVIALASNVRQQMLPEIYLKKEEARRKFDKD